MGKPFFILSLLMLMLKMVQGDRALVNILCGATASFTAPDGNQWVGDDQFIGSGSTARVQFTSSQAPFLSTVRYFPYGSMNCYRIPGVVTQGEAIKVIAIFHYGDYDSLALPPTFLLQIDSGGWTSVQTAMDPAAYTLTYRAVANAVSVCLAPDSTRRIPFISAIQVLSTQHDNPNPDPTPDPSEVSVKVKVRAKGKYGGLINLFYLLPGGFGVVIILVIVYLIKKNKMRRAEIQAELDAENSDSGQNSEA